VRCARELIETSSLVARHVGDRLPEWAKVRAKGRSYYLFNAVGDTRPPSLRPPLRAVRQEARHGQGARLERTIP
jgi:hypothetical protein